MTENPQLGRRAQTGSLSLPNQLGVSQTVVDPFVRPRQDNSGGDLVQLGQALSTLNPGLNSIVGRIVDAQEQQAKLFDSTQGGADRESIKDAMEAQQKLQANRGIWSPERIAGYEMADAQIHANMYPGALRQKLEETGLWNNEKASPEDIQSAMADVRQGFLARGDGNGPIWQRTFDQYRQGFENGIMNQWIERAGHIREDKAERMVADDLTSQLLSHQQLPTIDEVVKGFNDYAEKSFTNTVLYPSQVNRLKVQAFTSAHSEAVNSGNTALAERIMAAFDLVPTKDDSGNAQLLSRTQYGADALAKMHQDTYFMNRQLKAEEQDQKSEQKNDVLSRLFTLKENYRGNLPSQIPPILPDKQLRQDMESLGMDSDQEWERFRQGRLSTDNQIRTEEAQGTTDAAVRSVEKLRTDLYTAETKTQLNDVMARAHQMDSDPAFNSAVARERLNGLIVDMNGQMKRYQETGKLGSKAFQMTAQEVKNFGQTQGAVAQQIISKYQKDINAPMFKNLHLEQVGDPDTGRLDYGFTDLNQQMQDDLLKETDAVAGDKPWDQVDRATLRKASQTVIDRYKPLFEQRVNDITDQIKEDKKAKEDAQKIADQTDAATSMSTGKNIEITGPSGTPSGDAVRNVMSSRGIFQTIAGWGESFETGNPLSTPETSAVSGETDKIREIALGFKANVVDPPNGLEKAMGFIFDHSGDARKSQQEDKAKISAYMLEFPYNPVPNRIPMALAQRGYRAGQEAPMKTFSDFMTKLESNKELMDAVKETAQTHKMAAYKPELQAAYATARQSMADSLQALGVPTEVSTGNLYLKPEWIDWRDVPLFTYPSDIADEGNVKKVMANLKLDPKLLPDFLDAQYALTVLRSDSHGQPRVRPLQPKP